MSVYNIHTTLDMNKNFIINEHSLMSYDIKKSQGSRIKIILSYINGTTKSTQNYISFIFRTSTFDWSKSNLFK